MRSPRTWIGLLVTVCLAALAGVPLIPSSAVASGGSLTWSTAYKQGSASGEDVAVSPDGARVYATGTTGADYVTIGYGS